MGWITNKRNVTGHGISHGHKATDRMKAPLRKIIEIVKPGDNSMFGSGDWVKLECGHEVFSKGNYSARCRHCAKLLM
jgi:hypothetical protein